jgi:hypothetical protein
MTIHAVIRFLDSGGVISFLIKPTRKLEYLLRAVFNTVSASFAAIIEDMHLPARNLNFF